MRAYRTTVSMNTIPRMSVPRILPSASGWRAIASLVLADERPIGIDVLSVPRHHKNGALVSAHLHLNVTYLFYGDPALSLSHKADEVKGARWFDVEAIPRIVKEKAMLPVYAKLCERARAL